MPTLCQRKKDQDSLRWIPDMIGTPTSREQVPILGMLDEIGTGGTKKRGLRSDRRSLRPTVGVNARVQCMV